MTLSRSRHPQPSDLAPGHPEPRHRQTVDPQTFRAPLHQPHPRTLRSRHPCQMPTSDLPNHRRLSNNRLGFTGGVRFGAGWIFGMGRAEHSQCNSGSATGTTGTMDSGGKTAIAAASSQRPKPEYPVSPSSSRPPWATHSGSPGPSKGRHPPARTCGWPPGLTRGPRLGEQPRRPPDQKC